MNWRNIILTVFLVVMGAACAFDFGFSAMHLLKGVVHYDDLTYGIMLPLAFISALVTGRRANPFSWALVARSLVVGLATTLVGLVVGVLAVPLLLAAGIDVVAAVVFGGVLGSTKLNGSTN